jgi:hypothetical protein
VTKEYFNVLGKVIPALDIALDLVARPSIMDMAAKLKGSVQLYKDRVIVLREGPKSEDAVLLALVAKYVGFGLKITTTDKMTLKEIIEASGKSRKAVVDVLDKLKSVDALDQVGNDFRISDWKAYEYVVRRSWGSEPARITDFTKENNLFANQELIAYTIGYEGRELDQFLKLLSDEKVEVLVDVRKDAYSKQNTDFCEGPLSRVAADVKIKYVHLPELGVDYAQRQELKSSRDYDSYFKRYSEYLDGNPYFVSFLADLSKNSIICLMCYEKDFKRCHRSILAGRLEKAGVVFHHL